MLQIKNIQKTYHTGNLIQHALDGVSFNLRDHEFVAILGPSGSGKTTLLNVLGGLDHYDSGDLIINHVSTKKFSDKAWDAYRNHSVGFVFQNYHLIPHQSVVSNVELALSVSGVSKSERRTRALNALADVGLKEHAHKLPHQLSGGQMQRVAIARALVNNPDIVLADEPTGALDMKTGLQIMTLLKAISQDRLVVMVTHNARLADQYATRIIRLLDGKIIEDSNPFEAEPIEPTVTAPHKRATSSMSFLTSLMLSFSNLKTKKGRTFLTAFAGSIGIIGIALILSLSNGVHHYIRDIQKDTMASYPITIRSEDIDLSRMMDGPPATNGDEVGHPHDGIYVTGRDLELAAERGATVTHNNLTKFKNYLDDPSRPIHRYIGENGIVFGYDPTFSVYTRDPEGVWIDTDGRDLDGTPFWNNPVMSVPMMNHKTSRHFFELMPDADGHDIGDASKEPYELLSGTWPQAYDETVLILNTNHEIRTQTLYELGLLPISELKAYYEDIEAGRELDYPTRKIEYDRVIGKTYRLIPACDFYEKGKHDRFQPIEPTADNLKSMFPDAIELTVSGVVRLKDAENVGDLRGSMAYTRALTDHLIRYTEAADIVTAQKADPEHNILNGAAFAPRNDEEKIADVTQFIETLGISDKAALYLRMMEHLHPDDPEAVQGLRDIEESRLAASMDIYLEDPDPDVMLSLHDTLIAHGTYQDNLKKFGVISLDSPSVIYLYADRFEDKALIDDCIDDYNATVAEEHRIVYTDYVALLMSSVTSILNVITYVLIAFVSVSLIVSSIMIGIITYISVLERTKEIGILRAVGASKRNIAQVFNAETFIIGIFSGFLGIGISLLLQIPLNQIIRSLAGSASISARLPLTGAVILIALSVVLTVVSGLIPARKAAKKDPVTALRTD